MNQRYSFIPFLMDLMVQSAWGKCSVIKQEFCFFSLVYAGKHHFHSPWTLEAIVGSKVRKPLNTTVALLFDQQTTQQCHSLTLMVFLYVTNRHSSWMSVHKSTFFFSLFGETFFFFHCFSYTQLKQHLGHFLGFCVYENIRRNDTMLRKNKRFCRNGMPT